MSKERFNICLLAAKITDYFSREFTIGAMAAAKELDVNLTVLPGRYIGIQELNDSLDMHYEYQYNVLFDYAARGHFDYIIAAAGTIAYAYNRDEIRKFLERFKGTPVLCAAEKIEGFRCLAFDNASGITDAVKYLAEQGRKHIGMLAGNPGNSDCFERCNAYRNAVAECGLEFRGTYVRNCDVSYGCRADAEKLIDENPELDAVVCANDVIASVMYEVLEDRGIAVGKGVAVVGFDDQPFAKRLDPPLATVKADVRLMGRRAVEKAIHYLNNELDLDSTIKTEFMPRHSAFADIRFLKTPELLFSGDTDTIKENIKSYLSMLSPDEEEQQQLGSTLSNLIDTLDRHYIQNVVDDAAKQHVMDTVRGILASNWQLLSGTAKLYAVHESAYIWLIRNCRKENIGAVHELYNRFNVSMKKRLAAVNPKSTDRSHLENSFIRDSLMFGVNLRESYADILKRLCNIGSLTSYLYIMEKPVIHNCGFEFPDDINWLFKSYCYGSDAKSVPEAEQQVTMKEMFKNAYLVNDRPRILIGTVLYTAATHYGFALFEPEDVGLFDEIELITYQLSSAVRTLDILKNLNNLLSDVNTKNTALESETRIDELTRVYNRRGFYAAAEELIEKYASEENSYVICYLDTDNLRHVNEFHGHIEGDFTIKLSSDCLRHAFGKGAVIGRMGGGEFALIINKSQIISLDDVIRRKDRFVADFNKSKLKPYEFSVSIGIVETECSERNDLETALEKACNIIISERSAKNSGEHPAE